MQGLQECMRDVKLVICDEMSMVGRRLLGAIGRRLREAEARPGGPFGGIAVIFAGDCGQLLPVLDKLMYARQPGGGLLSLGGKAGLSRFDAPC